MSKKPVIAAPAAATAIVAAPATLPVIAPVSRGKAAPYIADVKRLLTGAGGTVAQLMAALKLSDRDARGVIDAIRSKEGYDALPRVGRVFVYKSAAAAQAAKE